MVIDATKKFARRTAQWLLTSGMNSKQIEERLRRFDQDHIALIGEQGKEIRGKK